MTLEKDSNIRPVKLVFIFSLAIKALLLSAGKIQMGNKCSTTQWLLNHAWIMLL